MQKRSSSWMSTKTESRKTEQLTAKQIHSLRAPNRIITPVGKSKALNEAFLIEESQVRKDREN